MRNNSNKITKIYLLKILVVKFFACKFPTCIIIDIKIKLKNTL